MTPKRSLAAALAAVCIATAGLIASAPAEAAAPPLTAEIETRDQLIADQEALLNAYRCMFAVDVAAVPGGCANGAPALPTGEPGPPPPNPAKADKDARDDLIAAQENLLNTYRCNHNIDTQLVPGGCPEPSETENADTGTVISDTEMISESDSSVDPWAHICPEEGVELSHWGGRCQEVDRYIDCSEDTVMDSSGYCYDPAIWGECPEGMALDFWGYCQGLSLDGICPTGWILDPWNYCQNPSRDDICGGRFRLDPWGSCYDPETVDPDF